MDYLKVKENSDTPNISYISRGEKLDLRLSKVLDYKQYIKDTLEFAKWAFSTKAHRETEKLKKHLQK